MHCELKFTDGVDKPMIKSAMQEALEIIEKKFPFDSTKIEISAVLRHTTQITAKLTDFYRFTIIKEKGKGPSLKIREIKAVPHKCNKCSKYSINFAIQGTCSDCYDKPIPPKCMKCSKFAMKCSKLCSGCYMQLNT